MPDFTMADILGAQAGAPGPVYEGGPTGNVRYADVLAALGLDKSWLDRAQKQAGTDVANYQQGGVPGLLADTGQTAELAGGFGGVTKGVRGKIAAPNIRDPNAPLFDYSRLGEVPNVPQFELPRYQPKHGVSERVGELVNDPKAEKAVSEAIDRGLKVGAEKFYNQEPLLDEFVSELGKKKGAQGFQRFAEFESATSPRSKVPENVRNASYYYVQDAQGNVIPTWEASPGNPAPYGHMAQQLQRQGAIDVQQGTWDPIKNPKPPSYGQNLQGNLLPGTIDAHAFKLPAMAARDPRFLLGSLKQAKDAPIIHPQEMYKSGALPMREALQRPAFWEGAPRANEYPAMEQFWRRQAERKGLATGQGQAAGWTGGGELTGNMSSTLQSPDPILKVFEDRVALTAESRGLTKAEVLRQFIRGQAPLLSVTPAAVLAGQGLQPQEPTQ